VTEWSVEETDSGTRLDAWLASRAEIGSRGRAREAIERGKVFLNGRELVFSDAGRRLRAGDRVGFWADRPGSARPRSRKIVATRHVLDIVFEDQAILVVNKPAGWLVEPLPGEERGEVTLVDLLADHLRDAARVRAHVVHRIDRDTSGLVLFALTPEARDHLKAQFERRTPERVYLAVVHGVVQPPAGTWRDTLVWDKARLVQKRAHVHEERAKDAVAHYRVMEQHERAAILEVSLVTGKRNQIRVQAGLRGHPLVGERIYRFGFDSPASPKPRSGEGGPKPRGGEDGIDFPRQALHAARLAFTHPKTRRRVEFTAALPDDLRLLVERLRRHRGLETAKS
jgi:23S rRNA pseudouridine1911/1915/1917 synthase